MWEMKLNMRNVKREKDDQEKKHSKFFLPHFLDKRAWIHIVVTQIAFWGPLKIAKCEIQRSSEISMYDS